MLILTTYFTAQTFDAQSRNENLRQVRQIASLRNMSLFFLLVTLLSATYLVARLSDKIENYLGKSEFLFLVNLATLSLIVFFYLLQNRDKKVLSALKRNERNKEDLTKALVLLAASSII